MKIIGILVGFLVVLSACSSKKDSNELPADWKKYGTANFEISFPKNWKLNEKPQAGVLFNILAPLDTKTDDFRENINYLTQDLSGSPMDLKQFIDLSLKQIQPVIAKGTTVESEQKNGKSGAYQRLRYQFKVTSYTLVVTQYIWVKGNKSHILTFTAEKDALPAYESISEQLLDSFHLKK
ncbi:MAG: hypothetical protein ACEQR5_06130 [Moraxellaceae bacterium]